MTCHELAQRLAHLRPELEATEVARLCLIILHQESDHGALRDDETLLAAWGRASFRLDATTDQHAAVADELESMCSDGPVKFTPDQLWTLLRAIKVQSQIVEMYTGLPSLA